MPHRTAPAPVTRRRVVDRAFDFAMRHGCKAYVNDDGERIIEGIATTPRVDRAGDTIDPLGVDFQLPLKLLWQHDPERPIGNVIAAKATPEGITFTARFNPPGKNAAVDQKWTDITTGLVDALSVGFRATKPPKATRTGVHYASTEWLELSVVTIGANPDCRITAIKAFAIDPVGASAANTARTETAAMTLKERIAASRARLEDLKTRAAELVGSDDYDQTELDTLNEDIETEKAELERLQRTLANIGENAAPAGAPAVVTRNGAPQTPSAPVVLRAPRSVDRPPAQLLIRSLASHVIAYASNVSVNEAAGHLFGNDEGLKGYLMVQRAAVDPALTTVPAWAGTLVRETWGEFLDLLQPVSVYARLSAMGSRFTFGASGKIILPARDPSPNLAGDFVGENSPIPVKKGSLQSTSLTPKKLAVISAFSAEMSAATGGDIENYIRDFIIADTAKLLDTRLLDNVAATAIRPAGLLNGVTPVPSSGATLADIIADIKAAAGPIFNINGGERLVWLMHPLQAMSLGLQTNAAGAFIWPNAGTNWNGWPVVVSTNVPQGTLILLDVSVFATVANDTPQFRVSAEATLHMEDTTPEPINDGTPASPVISLYQQDAFGIRMIQQMNWTMRRPGMVSAITGITW